MEHQVYLIISITCSLREKKTDGAAGEKPGWAAANVDKVDA